MSEFYRLAWYDYTVKGTFLSFWLLSGLLHMTGVEAHGMHAPSSEATGGSSLLSGQPRKQPHALVIMLQEIIQLALAQAAEES